MNIHNYKIEKEEIVDIYSLEIPIEIYAMDTDIITDIVMKFFKETNISISYNLKDAVKQWLNNDSKISNGSFKQLESIIIGNNLDVTVNAYINEYDNRILSLTVPEKICKLSKI